MGLGLFGLLSRTAGTALDLLFPAKCVGCGREGAVLCSSCRSSLPHLQPPFCDQCAQPITSGSRCRRCLDSPLAIDCIRSPFVMEGTIRTMILRLKYNDMRGLAPILAMLLADYLKANPMPCNMLMAVPIHPRRERGRGYNQSLALARELSKLTSIPVHQGLRRHKNSPPQARSQSMEERRANVQDAFSFSGLQLHGERVLLVDDVCTTGATLDACAKVLKDAGAGQVWGLTVAREA